MIKRIYIYNYARDISTVFNIEVRTNVFPVTLYAHSAFRFNHMCHIFKLKITFSQCRVNCLSLTLGNVIPTRYVSNSRK